MFKHFSSIKLTNKTQKYYNNGTQLEVFNKVFSKHW